MKKIIAHWVFKDNLGNWIDLYQTEDDIFLKTIFNYTMQGLVRDISEIKKEDAFKLLYP